MAAVMVVVWAVEEQNLVVVVVVTVKSEENYTFTAEHQDWALLGPENGHLGFPAVVVTVSSQHAGVGAFF
ncbi:hypothetical protein RJT34_06941 [Clitoria ternatea]|uniref:Uncharacterized protein n=1 Tax=Clitoria ternatea TaxID=43366 RepID=A0AAN9PTY5_CLITE